MATPEATAETGGELSLLLPAEEESESTGTGDSGEVDTLRTRLAIAEEELDASRIENQELESRIADLQARLSKVEELQKMVEIEDDSLAQMQADQAQQTDQTEAAGVMQQAAADSVTEAIEASEEALLEELLAEEAAAQADEQAVVDDTAVADDALAETAGTDGMMTEEAETEATVPPPAPVIVAPPVTRTPSIFDGILPPDIIDMIPSMSGILGDPIILGAVGGFVVLLIVLVVLKRRKSSSDDESGINASSDDDLFAEDDDDELTPINLPEGDTEGVTEGVTEAIEADSNIPDVEEFLPVEAAAEPADDVAATEIFSAVEMPEPESTAPGAAAEQDDVLNEVDVYLAYGLYDNAEDLLNSSLTENPDRADYRAKLLDTYFATKNGEAFSKEADKLKAMGDAAGNYWDRVQIMGYELAPDNPLFSDAKDSGLSAADLEIVKPQEADFDIGASDDDDNTSFSTTDFNLGEDDTGGDLDAAAEEIPQLDELPSLDGDDGSAETEFDAAVGLPDDVGEELEFSIDDETVATDDVELDDIALEFNIDGDEAAEVEDISEVNFDAGLDAEDSLKIEEEVDNFIDTAVVSPGADDKDKEDDDLDFGMEDSATDDLHSEEVSSAAAELNLDAEIIPLPVSNDDDISIIDFGGEDFVEPTDVVESIDAADDPTAMDFSIDDDDEVSTGTFAPGDFDEPTAAVDSIADIDDIGDLMLPDDVDEVSTKLDLARAFIDMGDTEGARGSLEEVMSEGNDEQKAEAEALLEQI
jgi:pilus assembly protein FimV